MLLAPRVLSLLIGKISHDSTTSYICYKSAIDLSANVLAPLKFDLSEHVCAKREKMNRNYTDKKAEKLEMMG